MNIQKKESSRIFYAFFCVAMRKGVIMSWRKCRNKLFALGLSALMWGNTFPGAVWASDLEMQNNNRAGAGKCNGGRVTRKIRNTRIRVTRHR